jgi:hypothetical protein
MTQDEIIETAKKSGINKNKVHIVFANSDDKVEISNKIVEQYHGYVASRKTVGRCLKYLVDYNNQYIGTFWLGSGFKPTPKPILKYFNLGQKQFDSIFNEVADNKRFCLIESIPNLGSIVLSGIRKRARTDWYNIYGNDLKAIITTIGGDRKGSVYLADNWKVIGETSGLPSDRKSVSMKWNTSNEINERYEKPTGENKKIILITESLGKGIILPTSKITCKVQIQMELI